MTTLKQFCLITLLSMIGALSVQALPAKAVVYDAGAVRQLQDRRGALKSKESNLLLDYDDIRKQIDDLSKRNDPSLDRRIDDLQRKLDSTYAKLQQVRFDLRDVDIKLI